MPDTDRHIILLVPGLAGPESDHPVSDYLQRRPASLDRLVSRGRAGPFAGDGLDATLLHCFGLDGATPVAPLTCSIDTGSRPSGYVLRADPVYLHADQSSLRLFEAHSFEITQQEADALAASFNAFYVDEAWRLRAPVPSRWYIELDEPPDMTTTPLAGVAGRDINPLLPQGKAARHWLAVLNEMQMLLHAHEVNLVREQQGKPTINSLWLWGGGTLPPAARGGPDRVLADDPLALALAQAAGAVTGVMPADAGQLLSQDAGTTLAVVDTLRWPACYSEVERWMDALHAMDEALMSPLLDALAGGSVHSLRLLPCNGQGYTITRQRLRGFWRRTRPFEQVFS